MPSVRIDRILVAAGLMGCVTAVSAAGGVPQHLQAFPVSELSEETRWAPCAFDVRDPLDRRAECAFVDMPLDYESPGTGTFRVMVKRLRATVKPTAQVWILHGGPSASATADLYRLSFGIPEQRPDIEYYAVDHRGMGGSERLGCTDDPSQRSDARGKWAACMDSLRRTVGVPRLMQITTSNAARDIGTLAAKYRQPGVKLIINGHSYGTTLAQRYLQIFPDQPDGVILIGIELGNALFYRGGVAYGYGLDWDSRMNDAVRSIFERCALAEECVGQFTKHPWDEARETMASLYAGHCAALAIEPDHVKEAFGVLSYATAPAVLPALMTRVKRCNESDRELLRTVVERWYPSITDFDAPMSPSSSVAGNLISASEALLEFPDELPVLQRRFSEELTVAYGVEKFYAQMQGVWITHPRDRYFGRWPDYRKPMLMLQGALDTATTFSQALIARSHYRWANQTWVVFPDGNHRLIGHTPTIDGGDCAKSLYLGFIDDPGAAVDKSCIARIRPIDWDGAAAAAALLHDGVEVGRQD